MRISVNKLNFVPEQIIPGLIGVFRNRRSLSSWKLYIPFVLLIRSCMHLPVSPMYTLPHSQGIVSTFLSCFRGSTESLGRTQCDFSVVSDLKTDCTPRRCRQRRTGSDKPSMYLISETFCWQYVYHLKTEWCRRFSRASQHSTHSFSSFLDKLVIRDSEGRLTASVYRKPTHTDQYLSYDSHHPQSVKRGVVKCLYDRSKNISTKPSTISEEKNHSSLVLVSIVYPYSIV